MEPLGGKAEVALHNGTLLIIANLIVFVIFFASDGYISTNHLYPILSSIKKFFFSW